MFDFLILDALENPESLINLNHPEQPEYNSSQLSQVGKFLSAKCFISFMNFSFKDFTRIRELENFWLAQCVGINKNYGSSAAWVHTISSMTSRQLLSFSSANRLQVERL